MKKYYRLMLGAGSKHAQECFRDSYVGTGFGIDQDLSEHLAGDWPKFNVAVIPIYLDRHPGKPKVTAGLACGAIWTVSKGLVNSDLVLCPDGQGNYHIGEIAGDYFHAPGTPLQHRRPVKWLGQTISRSAMSEALKKSTGAIGTVCNITGYAEEIEQLLTGSPPPPPPPDDVEDPAIFAMEKHLEEFLVANWPQTELGKDFEIYTDEGEIVGQQYPTDTGPIDILAISKDQKTLLVVELKKGRASDVVVGQTLRYMGYVQDELAESGQGVRGVIIALEDDKRLRNALKMVPIVDFYTYAISFKLVKSQNE